MTLFPLDSALRDYSWGKPGAISELLGREPSCRAEAELWMGAHPGAPSRVVPDSHQTPFGDLAELLRARPDLLGESDGQLPYLFKVLAADSPLSIQVHPNASQAKEGFEREEREGIPLSAPHRCYKDESPKPELLLALTPFYAFCGFVSPGLMVTRLRHYGFFDRDSPLREHAILLANSFSPESLSRVFAAIFALTDTERAELLRKVGGRLESDVSADLQTVEFRSQCVSLSLFPQELKRFSHVLLETLEIYPNDPGTLAALLLHWVELQPGHALYLPAGVLHSYVSGVGLEIMASSDNVLRGGLTPKYVSVDELRKTVVFAAQEPIRVLPRVVQARGRASVTEYDTPAPEFRLSLLSLEHGETFTGKGADILLVLEGEIDVRTKKQVARLSRGAQLFCAADEPYTIVGQARVARATSGRTPEYERHEPHAAADIS